MKYKCIGSLEKDGKVIMSEGDIVITRGDELYNITTGVDYREIVLDDVIGNLISVTDDNPYTPVRCTHTITDAERFKNITSNMLDTFRRKNHDYGNSFEQSLNEEGLAASRIRMGDKWNRYKTLSKPKIDAQVNDESIRDTLLDLANYAIMTVIWLDKQNGNV